MLRHRIRCIDGCLSSVDTAKVIDWLWPGDSSGLDLSGPDTADTPTTQFSTLFVPGLNIHPGCAGVPAATRFASDVLTTDTETTTPRTTVSYAGIMN